VARGPHLLRRPGRADTPTTLEKATQLGALDCTGRRASASKNVTITSALTSQRKRWKTVTQNRCLRYDCRRVETQPNCATCSAADTAFTARW
jgi:hypothetical protein